MNDSGADRVPVVAGPGSTTVRRDSVTSLARRRPGPDPLPDGGYLPLAVRPLRAQCWDLLPNAVAERMEELSGETVEWWARLRTAADDERPHAVLIGHAGAIFAEPRITPGHKPAYSLTGYLLDPDSFRHADVIWRPDLPKGADPSAEVVAAADRRGLPVLRGSAPPARRLVVPGLDSAAEELLSNLPVRAQKLLAAPFGADDPVLRCDWHYEGTVPLLSMFAVLLAGRTHLTLASGTRVVPLGHTEQSAHWSLVCYRARVVRRIGR